MGFDMALAIIRAGGRVARRNWQWHLSLEDGRIYATPIAGARHLWEIAQNDVLAMDWVVKAYA